jgi:hypothetical protein
MQATLSNHIPYSYLSAAGTGGRIAVPVPASQLPYAHFKNVTGVVSTSAAVYSLDKLNILNTLIDRLRSTRTDALASRESQGSSLTEERIDALIQQYGQELHAAVAANALPYTKPVGVVPGMLLSMAA